MLTLAMRTRTISCQHQTSLQLESHRSSRPIEPIPPSLKEVCAPPPLCHPATEPRNENKWDRGHLPRLSGSLIRRCPDAIGAPARTSAAELGLTGQTQSWRQTSGPVSAQLSHITKEPRRDNDAVMRLERRFL